MMSSFFFHSRFAAFLLALLACVAQADAAPGLMCHAVTGAQRGALVELYTSEGCSSCPPADRWFAGMAAMADPARLSLLAFHVDYWNQLGWLDRFSSAAFTARQKQRDLDGGSSTIYTPQVMLGQRIGFQWATENAMAAIHAMNALPSPLAIDMTATPAADGFDVALNASPAKGGALPSAAFYLALYENGLSTQVKAGENNGVLLRHDRVVRQLFGPFPLSGAVWSRRLRVAPPRDSQAGELGLTAFVQTASGEVLQAVSLPLGKCSRQ
jgi:hypothetical protein